MRNLKYSYFSVLDHYPESNYPGHRRTVGEFYEQLLDQSTLAEELGYDTFFIAEHHFHEYGACPNPAVLLAAVARQTKRIKLGTAVTVLPLRDPRVVAEDYAMLDQISGGRVMMGVGSGYLKHEFEGFGVKIETKRFAFDEALAVIEALWNGQRVTHKSEHFELKDVPLNILPRQKHVPTFVASLRPEVAYYVGKAGQNIMTVPYATIDRFEQIADMITEYKRGVAESTSTGGGDALVALHTFVGETDAQVREHAAEAFDLYVRTRSYAKSQTYDDIIKSGVSLFGSVDTVVEKLVKLREMGVNHVLMLQNFGGMAPELVKQSMTRIAREVMPIVNKRLSELA